MDDVTIKRIEEIPAYEGEHEIPGIRFRPAARALGVSAWGMNVLELDAGATGYPEHDHVGDGQEEVYVVLRGSATLLVGEESRPLEAGALARVPPTVRRKLLAGPGGVTVLAIGATPGKAFEPTLDV